MIKILNSKNSKDHNIFLCKKTFSVENICNLMIRVGSIRQLNLRIKTIKHLFQSQHNFICKQNPRYKFEF